MTNEILSGTELNSG